MFKIREGIKEDCIAIDGMIRELAVYEKMPDGPQIDSRVLEKDGFGEHKLFWTLIAELEDSGEAVGYALFFNKYSTWDGKCLFLEDIYVKPDHRGKGIGLALFKAVAKYGADTSCHRLEWNCLNWNHSSICFYKKLGATDLTTTEGWHTFRLDRQQLTALGHGSDDKQ